MVSFKIAYAVEVLQPLDVVLPALTSPDRTQEVLQLSGLPPSWYKPGQVTEDGQGNSTFTFSFAERVPILFGLTTTDVVLSVEQEVKPAEKLLIYKSTSNMVKVLKVRSFEAISPDKTRVSEELDLTCPWLLKRTVEHEAKIAHMKHMDNYHKMFVR